VLYELLPYGTVTALAGYAEFGPDVIDALRWSGGFFRSEEDQDRRHAKVFDSRKIARKIYHRRRGAEFGPLAHVPITVG
jgi:hypothetical protein